MRGSNKFVALDVIGLASESPSTVDRRDGGVCLSEGDVSPQSRLCPDRDEEEVGEERAVTDLGGVGKQLPIALVVGDFGPAASCTLAATVLA